MKTLALVVPMLFSLQTLAQQFISDSCRITFFSQAPVEDIKATNANASSLIDLASGNVAFSVPVKSFVFRKALMQQHFNENYMESHKYPTAAFTGKIKNYQPSPGNYQAVATGELSIHGVTHQVEIPGELIIGNGTLDIKAVFPVVLKDYKIKIPKILFSNIAEEVEVTVIFRYKPYESR